MAERRPSAALTRRINAHFHDSQSAKGAAFNPAGSRRGVTRSRESGVRSERGASQQQFARRTAHVPVPAPPRNRAAPRRALSPATHNVGEHRRHQPYIPTSPAKISTRKVARTVVHLPSHHDGMENGIRGQTSRTTTTGDGVRVKPRPIGTSRWGGILLPDRHESTPPGTTTAQGRGASSERERQEAREFMKRKRAIRAEEIRRAELEKEREKEATRERLAALNAKRLRARDLAAAQHAKRSLSELEQPSRERRVDHQPHPHNAAVRLGEFDAFHGRGAGRENAEGVHEVRQDDRFRQMIEEESRRLEERLRQLRSQGVPQDQIDRVEALMRALCAELTERVATPPPAEPDDQFDERSATDWRRQSPAEDAAAAFTRQRRVAAVAAPQRLTDINRDSVDFDRLPGNTVVAESGFLDDQSQRFEIVSAVSRPNEAVVVQAEGCGEVVARLNSAPKIFVPGPRPHAVGRHPSNRQNSTLGVHPATMSTNQPPRDGILNIYARKIAQQRQQLGSFSNHHRRDLVTEPSLSELEVEEADNFDMDIPVNHETVAQLNLPDHSQISDDAYNYSDDFEDDESTSVSAIVHEPSSNHDFDDHHVTEDPIHAELLRRVDALEAELRSRRQDTAQAEIAAVEAAHIVDAVTATVERATQATPQSDPRPTHDAPVRSVPGRSTRTPVHESSSGTGSATKNERSLPHRASGAAPRASHSKGTTTTPTSALSPQALMLKMAAQLEHNDALDRAITHVTELEGARKVAEAQQESAVVAEMMRASAEKQARLEEELEQARARLAEVERRIVAESEKSLAAVARVAEEATRANAAEQRVEEVKKSTELESCRTETAIQAATKAAAEAAAAAAAAAQAVAESQIRERELVSLAQNIIATAAQPTQTSRTSRLAQPLSDVGSSTASPSPHKQSLSKPEQSLKKSPMELHSSSERDVSGSESVISEILGDVESITTDVQEISEDLDVAGGSGSEIYTDDFDSPEPSEGAPEISDPFGLSVVPRVPAATSLTNTPSSESSLVKKALDLSVPAPEVLLKPHAERLGKVKAKLLRTVAQQEEVQTRLDELAVEKAEVKVLSEQILETHSKGYKPSRAVVAAAIQEKRAAHHARDTTTPHVGQPVRARKPHIQEPDIPTSDSIEDDFVHEQSPPSESIEEDVAFGPADDTFHDQAAVSDISEDIPGTPGTDSVVSEIPEDEYSQQDGYSDDFESVDDEISEETPGKLGTPANHDTVTGTVSPQRKPDFGQGRKQILMDRGLDTSSNCSTPSSDSSSLTSEVAATLVQELAMKKSTRDELRRQRQSTKSLVNETRRKKKEEVPREVAELDAEISAEKAKLDDYFRELGTSEFSPSVKKPFRPEPTRSVTPPSVGHQHVRVPSPSPSRLMPDGKYPKEVTDTDVDTITQMLLDDMISGDDELSHLIERHTEPSPVFAKRSNTAAWDVTVPISSPDKQRSATFSPGKSRSPSPETNTSVFDNVVGTSQEDVLSLGGRIVDCFLNQGCDPRSLPLKWADVENVVLISRERTTEDQKMHSLMVFDCVNEILTEMFVFAHVCQTRVFPLTCLFSCHKVRTTNTSIPTMGF